MLNVIHPRTNGRVNKTSTENSTIVITGGGSGGHTVTAVSVIDELVSRNPEVKSRILYVGGLKGMEGEKVSQSVESRVAQEYGITFLGIRSGKLQRRFSFSTVIGLGGVIGGLLDSFSLFKRYPVSVVFSTGGYVTVPVCFVAWLKKIPVVIHEQTTKAGLANRISSIFATKVLLGFESASSFFSPRKATFVGNTLRKELNDSRCWPKDLTNRLAQLKKMTPAYPTALIAGGGQGSHLLNSITLIALKSLVSHFNIIVLTGDNKVNRDYDKFISAVRKLSSEQQDRVLVLRYAQACEMGLFYRNIDLFVGRGGALMVYEVGAFSIPSVIIPIPWVTQNEQFHNASVLVEAGIAKILPEGELSPEILFQEMLRMVSKVRGGLLKIDDKLRERIFVKDAQKKIVDVLLPFIG